MYKDYCWLKGCTATYLGPEHLEDSVVLNLFRAYIDDELQAKGFIKNEDDSDFLVNLRIVLEEKKSFFAYPADFDDVSTPSFIGEEYDYVKGSLIIDMLDTKSGKLIWRSDAVKYLQSNPQVKEKEMRRGVSKSLRKFPPGIDGK